MYEDNIAIKSTRYEKKVKPDAAKGAVAAGLGLGGYLVHSLPDENDLERHEELTRTEPEEVEKPSMSVPMTIGLLVVVTVVC